MKKFISAFILFIPAFIAIAQPGGDPTPSSVPIDGGVSYLAAAGIAYGIKKYRDSMKKG